MYLLASRYSCTAKPLDFGEKAAAVCVRPVFPRKGHSRVSHTEAECPATGGFGVINAEVYKFRVGIV